MCSILVVNEDTGFSVKDLKDFLRDKDDNLLVNIHVLKHVGEGIDEGFILPLEAVGTGGDEISLTCFDT